MNFVLALGITMPFQRNILKNQQDEPSGFEKIKATIDPGAAFDLPNSQNLSGSSMNDLDDDDDFDF